VLRITPARSQGGRGHRLPGKKQAMANLVNGDKVPRHLQEPQVQLNMALIQLYNRVWSRRGDAGHRTAAALTCVLTKRQICTSSRWEGSTELGIDPRVDMRANREHAHANNTRTSWHPSNSPVANGIVQCINGFQPILQSLLWLSVWIWARVAASGVLPGSGDL
jgi:hypothetical protein